MALIIKGDMPKDCTYCFAYDDDYRQCRLEPTYDGLWSRDKYCPILGEILDEHGGLVQKSDILSMVSDYIKGYEHDPSIKKMTASRASLILEKPV